MGERHLKKKSDNLYDFQLPSSMQKINCLGWCDKQQAIINSKQRTAAHWQRPVLP